MHYLAKGNRSLTLLGFLLDPDNPVADDRQILEKLFAPLCENKTGRKELESLDRLGGRWILIVDNGADAELVTDFFGMRQVLHTVPQAGMNLWCASQFGLLHKVLDLPLDPEALDYLETSQRQGDSECWWPGTSTLSSQVKCLAPNHVLNLATGNIRRFWPKHGIAPTSLRRGVKDGARLLSGLMKAAANRFHLTILISSGLDSRLLLASARDVRERVTGLTFLLDGLTPESADVAVPSRLLPSLGISHKILDCTRPMDPEFSRLYLSNTTPSHEAYGKVAFGIFHSGLTSSLRVTGAGAEAFRAIWHRYDDSKPTAPQLALTGHLIEHPFVLKELAAWMESIPDTPGMQLVDFFYLEQRLGRWLSEGQTEWDIAQDAFTPFDCRALVEQLKGVNEEYQREPEFELFHSLMRELWPEVLRQPINPHKNVPGHSQTLKSTVRHALVRSHLLDYIPTDLVRFGKRLLPSK
jgi:hypothetical protein